MLARIGLTFMSPALRERVEQLPGADEELAAVTRADLERIAALLESR
jgi:hypothetical protein